MPAPAGLLCRLLFRLFVLLLLLSRSSGRCVRWRRGWGRVGLAVYRPEDDVLDERLGIVRVVSDDPAGVRAEQAAGDVQGGIDDVSLAGSDGKELRCVASRRPDRRRS